MEIKAYVEGFLCKWWLFVLILVLSLWVGGIVGKNQTSQYTASTTILLNDTLVANTAIPSKVVQLSTPLSYQAQVASPAILDQIIKAYPGLVYSQLKQAIVITADSTNQLLLISVTDSSPKRAADIANFLAQSFVRTQSAALTQQLDYYKNLLFKNILHLQKEIDKLSIEIQSITPPPAQQGTAPIDLATQQTLARDEQDLISDKQALIDIQNAEPLFHKAYVILQPANVPDVPVVAALSPVRIQLIAAVIGVFVAIVLIVSIEYFTPFVRYGGELQRVVGLPVLAELPKMFSFEQKRLLQLRPPLLRWRIETLRLLAASIGAPSIRDKGRVVLLTSSRRKRRFAAVLATLLAYNGHRTLLIDADFEKPWVHEQIKLSGSCDIVTNKGLQLSFISKTMHPHLFVLLATAELTQNEHLTSNSLITLLPELQTTFSTIIIDAPPLDRADAHLLARKASQTLLLVKKRRESLKTLKMTHAICQKLGLHARCLLLA
jgi:non-specific protein-tyrosine kinase